MRKASKVDEHKSLLVSTVKAFDGVLIVAVCICHNDSNAILAVAALCRLRYPLRCTDCICLTLAKPTTRSPTRSARHVEERQIEICLLSLMSSRGICVLPDLTTLYVVRHCFYQDAPALRSSSWSHCHEMTQSSHLA